MMGRLVPAGTAACVLSVGRGEERDVSSPDHLPVVTLVIERTGGVLAEVELADTGATRRKGLLGRDALAPGTGLYLRPCASIHTWFMRFPIDVVFLGAEGRILKIVARLAPFRLAWGGLHARDTLELPAGAASRAGLLAGDRLSVR
jgi:uncharacterized membrane protein (UPF0127 family)